MISEYKNRITGNSTTTVLSATCLISQIVISCAVSGTTWTIKIQDKSTSPFVLVPPFTLSVPTDGYPNVIINFEQPIRMDDGVDIVTATGAGTREVSVWLVVIQ